jgi:hypothetical protein
VACTLPCLTCQSAGICASCANGYYLVNAACFTCLTNCLSCTSSDTCKTCVSGYYFNGSSLAIQGFLARRVLSFAHRVQMQASAPNVFRGTI